jgi:hypothetical protein
MFTLKEMETYIVDYHSILALDYIKDQCYERKCIDKKLELIEENESGKKYRSSLYYQDVLKLKLYAQKVRQYFISIMPKQKNRQGTKISQKEAFEILFRDAFNHRTNEVDRIGKKRRNYVSLANICPEKKVISGRIKSVATMEQLLKHARGFGYFTPNMFYKYQARNKSELRHLVSIVLDFDLDTRCIVMSKDELHDFIVERIKVAPNLIWDTKTNGNYQASINIEIMPGMDKSVNLYEQIMKELAVKLEYVDEACLTAEHYFSKPVNNDGRSITMYHKNTISIDDFRWVLRDRDIRRKEESKSKIVEFSHEAIRRHEAIYALFNAEIVEGRRNNACFTLALVMRHLGHSEEECENYIISEWYPAVKKRSIDKDRFTKSEAYKCVKHAYSGKYKSFDSNYVQLVTGIECDLGGYIRTPYENQGIYELNNKEKVIQFLTEQKGRFEGTMQDIADATLTKKRTLERVLKELREENVIAFESVKGRGKTTVYELVEYQGQLTIVEEAPVTKDHITLLELALKAIEEDANRNPQKYEEHYDWRNDPKQNHWRFEDKPMNAFDRASLIAVMESFDTG